MSTRALILGLAAVMTLAPAAAVAGTPKFDSKVKVKDFVPLRAAGPVQPGAFLGRVKSSDNDNCATDRKVKLFRKKPGPDKLLGSNFSDPTTGHWEIGAENKPGAYYAKVNRVEIPAGICKRDRSRNFVVD